MTSIYVFENINHYNRVYPESMRKNLMYKQPLVDLYIKHREGKPDSLWVITNSNKSKERPELNHSLVHFRNGNADRWLDGTETKVDDDNIWYDYKKKQLVIAPKWLGKPAYEHHVDRYVGDDLKKNSKLFDYTDSMAKIDYSQRFYDRAYNRIIFILDQGQMSNSPRGISKNESPIFSQLSSK